MPTGYSEITSKSEPTDRLQIESASEQGQRVTKVHVLSGTTCSMCVSDA